MISFSFLSSSPLSSLPHPVLLLHQTTTIPSSASISLPLPPCHTTHLSLIQLHLRPPLAAPNTYQFACLSSNLPPLPVCLFTSSLIFLILSSSSSSHLLPHPFSRQDFILLFSSSFHLVMSSYVMSPLKFSPFVHEFLFVTSRGVHLRK